MIVDFVDENRAEFGVEFICTQLQVAPSSYYAARKRRTAPSARAVRDAVMMQVLLTLWVANRKVYGAHKLWQAARRAGHDVGRDQVARLMRQLGDRGRLPAAEEGLHDQAGPGRRQGPGPGEPALHRGPARRLVGDRPDLRPDPLGDGVRVLHRRRLQSTHRRVAGRREHEDRDGPRRLGDGPPCPRRPPARRTGHALGCRSQFTSVRFTERVEEIGARPSIGTVADSYDNALAETTNGLYKTECVYGPDSAGWDDVDELELATLSWVHWFNESRLHGHCNDVPPAEYEAAFYAAQEANPAGVGIQ